MKDKEQKPSKDEKEQLKRFKEKAKELECDTSESALDDVFDELDVKKPETDELAKN